MSAYKIPKMVVHIEQTSSDIENAEDIINTFSDNMKLTKNERKLLLAYSEFKSGFRPAMELLSRRTGILVPTLKYVRNQLNKRNIIYMNSEIICLRWNDYRSICLADPFMMQDGLKGKLCLMPFVHSVCFEKMTEEELSEYFYNSKKLVETLSNLDDKASDTLCRRLVKYKKDLEKEDWQEANYKLIPDEDELFDTETTENPFKNIPEEQYEGDDLPF